MAPVLTLEKRGRKEPGESHTQLFALPAELKTNFEKIVPIQAPPFEEDTDPLQTLAILADKLDELALKSAAGPQPYKGLKDAARKIRVLLDSKNAVDRTLAHAADKLEWLKNTISIMSVLRDDPRNIYMSVRKMIEYLPAHELGIRRLIDDCEDLFETAWNECLARLERHRIRRVTVPVGAVVGRGEIKAGWELRNPEERTADEEHQRYEVYKVLRNGIQVDDELVRRPVLYVYGDYDAGGSGSY